MQTKERIHELLSLVYDPELGVNIIDLGLIYDVQHHQEKIYVKMTLTTPGCPLHDSIVGSVKTILKGRLEVDEVEVDVVWEPRWTPKMISEDGKVMLGYYDR